MATRLERATFSLEGRDRCVVSAENTSTYETPDPSLVSSLATSPQPDAQLDELIASWPLLPAAIKTGISAMIRAAIGGAAAHTDTEALLDEPTADRRPSDA